MIPNALIADQRVSLAAKALWAYIASKPEGWTFRRQAMASQLGICVNTLNKLCRELIVAGWLEREQIRVGKPANYRLGNPNSTVNQNLVHQNIVHQNLVHQNLTHNSNKEYSKKDYSKKEIESAPLSKNAKIEAFKEQAKQAARQMNLPAEDAYKFVLYWTQQGRRKMLYEEQRGFDIEARLKMWALNEK